MTLLSHYGDFLRISCDLAAGFTLLGCRMNDSADMLASDVDGMPNMHQQIISALSPTWPLL